jgi:DNA-binding beta-propeller fold protein YncE
VGTQAGEFRVEDVAAVIEALIKRFTADGTLERGIRDFGTDSALPPAGSRPGQLRYPGRAIAHGPDRVYVSDTGHDRVLELRMHDWGALGFAPKAEVVRTWGGGAGFADGDAGSARFRTPQGLAFVGETLYVADRANNAIRAIDLSTDEVTTVAGTGRLGDGAVRPGPALATSLRSPWGLLGREGKLFVTMAGTHQLFTFHPGSGRLELFAGTGAENIGDGMRGRATLAQPMGLADDPMNLYFADSESSAIRRAGFGALDAVRTVVGTGLFDHGDHDGTGDDVRLQHPEDVAVHRRTMIVADTYNDKLKNIVVGPRTSFAMPGEAGSGDGLVQPAGVWADDDRVIVTDTGQHRIALVDPATGRLDAFEIT